MSGDVQVLARITAADFWRRHLTQQDEIRAWLKANGVDPNVIPADHDSRPVEVVLMDAPAIARDEYVLDADGHLQWGPRRDAPGREPLLHRVHSLLRVPLPEHLADPT